MTSHSDIGDESDRSGLKSRQLTRQRRKRKEVRVASRENLESHLMLDPLIMQQNANKSEMTQLEFELRILQSLIPCLRTQGDDIGEVKRSHSGFWRGAFFARYQCANISHLPKTKPRHVRLDQNSSAHSFCFSSRSLMQVLITLKNSRSNWKPWTTQVLGPIATTKSIPIQTRVGLTRTHQWPFKAKLRASQKSRDWTIVENHRECQNNFKH